jgi:hypothetical protein
LIKAKHLDELGFEKMHYRKEGEKGRGRGQHLFV